MNEHHELLGVLEPGQRSGPGQAPLPRRVLGRGTLVLLVMLRVYVLLAVPVVGWAFVHALSGQR